jgi:hypothetical protein
VPVVIARIVVPLAHCESCPFTGVVPVTDTLPLADGATLTHVVPFDANTLPVVPGATN